VTEVRGRVRGGIIVKILSSEDEKTLIEEYPRGS